MDLAAVDILRSRELGVPRYNQFRKLLHLKPFETFEELTDNPEWAEEIRRVYENDINRVDLMIGLFAERPPIFTIDYTTKIYTEAGMEWIGNNTMSTVLLRHYPQL